MVVVALRQGGAAAASGQIMVGDSIIAVNGTIARGLNVEAMLRLVRYVYMCIYACVYLYVEIYIFCILYVIHV